MRNSIWRERERKGCYLSLELLIVYPSILKLANLHSQLYFMINFRKHMFVLILTVKQHIHDF